MLVGREEWTCMSLKFIIAMDGLTRMCVSLCLCSNCTVMLPDLVSGTWFATKVVIGFFAQLSYKQLPFAGCKIALFGFKEEEELDMVGIAEKNGKEGGERQELLLHELIL